MCKWADSSLRVLKKITEKLEQAGLYAASSVGGEKSQQKTQGMK